MKKILIVIDNYQIGGAENQAFHLAKELKQIGKYDVEFMALFKMLNEPLKDKLQKENISTKYFKSYYLSHSRLKSLFLLFDFIRFRRNNKYYIISYTIRPNLFCARMWEKGLGKKFIWNQEDVGIGFPGPQDGKLFRRLLKEASGIISNSQVAADHLIRFSSNLKSKIQVIRNGVRIPEKEELDINSKEAIRQMLSLPNGSKLFIKLANITHFKDHKTVIDALRLLNNFENKSWHLLLVGRKGDTYNELMDYIQSFNLEDKVIFSGFTKNVSLYIKAADIAVYSSLSEGIPNGILEPMSYCLPVIASKIPGNIEALGEEYPYYFLPGDAFELSKLLQQFLNNEKLAKDIGESCYQYVHKNFSLDRMVKETENIINRI